MNNTLTTVLTSLASSLAFFGAYGIVAANRPAVNETDHAKARYYYVEGSVALAEGRNGEAYELMKKASSSDPGYEEANYAYALMRMLLRNDTLQTPTEIRRSLDLMRGFVDKYPSETGEAMNYSFLAAQSGDLDEAIRVGERTEKIAPSLTSVLLQLAQYYAMKQDMDRAIQALERYERIEGENSDLSIRKLQFMLNKGDTAAMLEESRRLVSEHPVSPDYLLLRGNVMEVLEMPDSALACYLKAETLDPDDGRTKLTLANYYLQKGDSAEYDRKSAEAILSENIELEEKLDMMTRYMHNIIADSADTRRASRLFDGLLRQYPHELEVLDLGAQFFAATDNMTRAEELMSYAIDLDSDNPDYRSRLASFYYSDGDYQKTLEVCEESLAKLPEEPRGLLLVYSAAASMLDRTDIALETYQKLLNQDLPGALLTDSTQTILKKVSALPIDALSRIGDIFSMAADATHKRGDTDLALRQYETSIALNPDNAMALNNYAYYLALAGGDLEKAQEMSRKALDSDPDNPVYIDTLAWIYYLQEKYDEALTLQESAIEKADLKDAATAEYWDHLGDIQYRCGLCDKAVESWKKARALDKDNKTISDKIKRRGL